MPNGFTWRTFSSVGGLMATVRIAFHLPTEITPPLGSLAVSVQSTSYVLYPPREGTCLHPLIDGRALFDGTRGDDSPQRINCHHVWNRLGTSGNTQDHDGLGQRNQ